MRLVFISCLCFLFLGCFLFDSQSFAARKNSQKPPAPSEVNTEYFRLKIPRGWKLASPVKSQPNGGISAAFEPDDNSLVVTINVIRADESAQKIAESTVMNMKRSGFDATTPQERSGIWEFSISGKADGRAWFGANGTLCGIILMFGENFARADALLANLRAKDPSLFPKKANL